jgi:pentatricopeptide repeat protein
MGVVWGLRTAKCSALISAVPGDVSTYMACIKALGETLESMSYVNREVWLRLDNSGDVDDWSTSLSIFRALQQRYPKNGGVSSWEYMVMIRVLARLGRTEECLGLWGELQQVKP